MARSYPIWHDVEACHYKQSKSYGGKSNSGETIYVGTSGSNSHEHCKVLTTRREEEHPKYGMCYVFRTSIDNVILKETWISIEERDIVLQRTKLNKIKSL